VRPKPGSPCSPLSVATPPVSSHATEWQEAKLQRSRHRAPVPSVYTTASSWWTARPGPSPSCEDLVHRIILGYFIDLAERSLDSWEINTRSRFLHSDAWCLKNNSRYTPSHYQKLQIGPYNFLSPYLCNRNSDFGDSCAKILKITFSFISCNHITHVCCSLLIDCVCFALGNIVLESFFEDFQDQAFEESQIFFAEQQGKCP
jgi:hypothetical protein